MRAMFPGDRSILPAVKENHRRRRRPTSIYVVYAIAGLVVWKFLFDTEPLPPSSIRTRQSFTNQSVVAFKTTAGVFVMQLYQQAAPKTTAHFLDLVHDGFYAEGDTGFYRHDDARHVLQAGGFVHGKQPPSRVHPVLPIEYKRPSVARTVVLARKANDPSSGNADFAIMLEDNSLVNKPSAVDGNPGYTTFGRIIEGWPVLARIRRTMGNVGYVADRAHVVIFSNATVSTRWLPNERDPGLERVYYEIQSRIDDAPYAVVLFSKTTCPFCARTKAILEAFDAHVEVVELNALAAGARPYQDVLAQLTGRRTVPNVFVRGRSIGGCDEIQALRDAGTLGAMLEDAGALAKRLVKSRIHETPLVVFSKSTCPFCQKVKRLLLDQLHVPAAAVEIVELDLRDDGQAIQFFLAQLTNRWTVPNVFLAGQNLGGADALEGFHERGELEIMLQRANVLKEQRQ